MFGGARSWNWLAIKRFAPVSRATRLMYSSELFETIYRKYQINGHKMGITVRIIRSNGRWFSLFCTIPVAMLKNSYFTINLLFMALPCGACLPSYLLCWIGKRRQYQNVWTFVLHANFVCKMHAVRAKQIALYIFANVPVIIQCIFNIKRL